MTKNLLLIFTQIFLICLVPARSQPGNRVSDLIPGKESLRIIITDSGIGGLAVMDDIAAKLEKSKIYREVDLIFVNALFDAGSGYNALKSRDEKLMRFNKALEGMNKQFSPDLIFVACNTL